MNLLSIVSAGITDSSISIKTVLLVSPLKNIYIVAYLFLWILKVRTPYQVLITCNF